KSVFTRAVGLNDSRVKSRPNKYRIQIQIRYAAGSSEIPERRIPNAAFRIQKLAFLLKTERQEQSDMTFLWIWSSIAENYSRSGDNREKIYSFD
uniref:Uncharacterized protein n=1 Tax=Romanomermis culicivorax TaxID=13658 RepID=A0A915HNC9_ROMCU